MLAAIDIGSNSIRMATDSGIIRSTITKLADGLQFTGKLSETGIAVTEAALRSYIDECRALGCEKTIAFATEAVRRAADGNDFIARIKKNIGLDIILLSHEQEAELALFGADKPSGAVTVCDLGGGSLEVISSPDGTRPDYVKSLPLGVVVLKNTFDGDYRKAIDTLPQTVSEYGEIQKRPVVISGGSACAIAAGILDLKVYDKTAVTRKFTAKQLDEFMPIALSPKLATFRPVCARRADTLPYGAIIIQALLNHLNATEFHVSDAGNLDAIIKGYKI